VIRRKETMSADLKTLLQERGEEYGEAWLSAGQVMVVLGYRHNLFRKSMFAHNWVLILSKMMRALHSPYKEDTWRDIAGYATLCADYCKQRVESEGRYDG
jgi:hypothetical protein